jgi:hypothetical protein
MRNLVVKPEPGTEPRSSGLSLGSNRIFLAIPVTFCKNQEFSQKRERERERERGLFEDDIVDTQAYSDTQLNVHKNSSICSVGIFIQVYVLSFSLSKFCM